MEFTPKPRPNTNAINFGTDGWRAIVGQDFTDDNLTRVATATAQVFLAHTTASSSAPTVIIGYDTRAGADRFARLAAEVMAACGLHVVLSDRYLPTPALCWSVKQDPHAIGGIQLTASHNPAQYLGFKVRMADGGAAPVEFTQEIEAAVTVPYDRASPARYAELTRTQQELSSTDRVSSAPCAGLARNQSTVDLHDLVTPYLATLRTDVDASAIRAAAPRLVIDPLFGAGRGYLASLLRDLGATVTEIHGDPDPTFGGLHPEPIPPWTDAAAAAVLETGAQAAFITDGDADRIGAIDETGAFVSPHKIIALIAQHLVEDRHQTGRIVKTLSTSVLVDRIGRALNCPVTTTPIGFKWIYAEMLKGDVLVGGEESGGIGIPTHVFERDGLLMALLLTEMMAQRTKSLKTLVADLEARVGKLVYQRIDLPLDPKRVAPFMDALPQLNPQTLAALPVLESIHTDGAKFLLPDDAWLLLRPSGTEPIVRVYAEAPDAARVEALLAAGQALVEGEAQ